MSEPSRTYFSQISVKSQISLGFGLILLMSAIIAVIGYANLRSLQNEAEAALQSASRIRVPSLQIEDDSLTTNRSISQEQATDTGDFTGRTGVAGDATIATAQARLETISRRGATGLILTTIFALSAGGLAAYLLGQQITSPLRQLSQAAEQIGQGNLDQHIDTNGGHEMVTLARSFNSMAAQLRQLMGRLEQLVADRTRALQASTKVSRSLSTILDKEQLVREVVEQIKSTFAYYHAHIYLFDDEQTSLVMVGGTGAAGSTMLARGHRIDRGQGLVGRAADTNGVVLVSNVKEAVDWLPNPLLPETRSEIAVPIAIGEQVLGVLDVQHDVIGGLTDEDARLLQSVASQVAIALRNARLYQQARQRAEREAVINAINEKIRKANDIESVLQVTAQELGSALGARRAAAQIGKAPNHQNGS